MFITAGHNPFCFFIPCIQNLCWHYRGIFLHSWALFFSKLNLGFPFLCFSTPCEFLIRFLPFVRIQFYKMSFDSIYFIRLPFYCNLFPGFTSYPLFFLNLILFILSIFFFFLPLCYFPSQLFHSIFSPIVSIFLSRFLFFNIFFSSVL